MSKYSTKKQSQAERAQVPEARARASGRKPKTPEAKGRARLSSTAAELNAVRYRKSERYEEHRIRSDHERERRQSTVFLFFIGRRRVPIFVSAFRRQEDG